MGRNRDRSGRREGRREGGERRTKIEEQRDREECLKRVYFRLVVS